MVEWLAGRDCCIGRAGAVSVGSLAVRIPKELLEVVADGSVVPFVGAGVSMDVSREHFCSWRELLNKMRAAVTEPRVAGFMEYRIEQGMLLEAAECASENLGPAKLKRVLEEAVGYREAVGDLSLPRAIWDLGPRRVITTNYDSVMKWANQKSTIVLSRDASSMSSFLNPKETPLVWHLHGHVGEFASVVLTKSQYETLYESKSVEAVRARDALRTAWTTFPLLFIGFGMSDDVVMASLERMLKLYSDHAPDRYALVCEADNKKMTIWTEYKVTPILYSGHGAALRELLREIREQAGRIRSGGGGRVKRRRVLEVPSTYIGWLERDCRDVVPYGIEKREQLSMHLRHVYVPALVQRLNEDEIPESADDKSGRWSRRRTKAKKGAEQKDLSNFEKVPGWELLLHAIGRHSMLIEGNPGSGKSTFCRWLCLQVHCGIAGDTVECAEDQFREELPKEMRKKLLAIRLPLRELAREFCEHRRMVLSVAELQGLLENYVDTKPEWGMSGEQLRGWLEAGQTLLILDGVDEVPVEVGLPGDDATRWEPRSVLLECLPAAVSSWCQRGNRVLITSRPYCVLPQHRSRLQGVGLRFAQLQPLPPQLQDLLVLRWFSAVQQSAEVGKEIATGMLREVRALSRVVDLIENPLLLTSICVIYGEGKRLPQDIHELYERIVSISLHAKYSPNGIEISRQRGRLVAIARGMHLGLDGKKLSPTFESHQHELKQILGKHLGKKGQRETDDLIVVQTLEDLLNRSGLLRSKTTQTAEFTHASFQEFLAAEALLKANEGVDAVAKVFTKHGRVSSWRNTLQFLFARRVDVFDQENAEKLTLRVLQAVVPDTLGKYTELAVVGCDMVNNMLDRGWQLPDELRERFTIIFRGAVEHRSPEQVRMMLAMVEGRLGDRRPELDLRNAAAWVDVPAGEYRYGEHSELRVLEAGFQLGRFPVTNQQFREFVEAGGYLKESVWSAGGWAWRVSALPEDDPGSLAFPGFDGATQPVVCVSWWEAEAFCNWLSECNPEHRYFLPSEEQWEAAARGKAGSHFPWGDKWGDGRRCNSEGRLDATSPVGIYPYGRAVCGAEEMAGHVWEWTASDWGLGVYGRVFRGGCWLDDSDDCSAWCRILNSPEDRNGNVGFRLARTLPLSPLPSLQ